MWRSTAGSWRRTVAGSTALAIFAHPDDESLACGGTLARLADAGVRVVLLCASRGEAGSLSDPTLLPDGDLGASRIRELTSSAAIPGVRDRLALGPSHGRLPCDHLPHTY